MDYKPLLLTGALLANPLDLGYARNSYSNLNDALVMEGTSDLESEVSSPSGNLASFVAIPVLFYFVYQLGKTIREERNPSYKKDRDLYID